MTFLLPERDTPDDKRIELDKLWDYVDVKFDKYFEDYYPIYT